MKVLLNAVALSVFHRMYAHRGLVAFSFLRLFSEPR